MRVRRIWVVDAAFGAASEFFFFQAEDGIRDLTVTGVQTCALPICAAAVAAAASNALPPCASICAPAWAASGDRKSTRLNSSHSQISYAVFCLKKKKPNNPGHRQSQ